MLFIENDEQLFIWCLSGLESCITFHENLPSVDAEAAAQARVRALVRELRVSQGLTYKDLVARLAKLGLHIDDRVLNNRINRGTFTAGFLVLLLQALNAQTLEVTKAPARLRATQR